MSEDYESQFNINHKSFGYFEDEIVELLGIDIEGADEVIYGIEDSKVPIKWTLEVDSDKQGTEALVITVPDQEIEVTFKIEVDKNGETEEHVETVKLPMKKVKTVYDTQSLSSYQDVLGFRIYPNQIGWSADDTQVDFHVGT